MLRPDTKSGRERRTGRLPAARTVAKLKWPDSLRDLESDATAEATAGNGLSVCPWHGVPPASWRGGARRLHGQGLCRTRVSAPPRAEGATTVRADPSLPVGWWALCCI